MNAACCTFSVDVACRGNLICLLFFYATAHFLISSVIMLLPGFVKKCSDISVWNQLVILMIYNSISAVTRWKRNKCKKEKEMGFCLSHLRDFFMCFADCFVHVFTYELCVCVSVCASVQYAPCLHQRVIQCLCWLWSRRKNLHILLPYPCFLIGLAAHRRTHTHTQLNEECVSMWNILFVYC